MATDAIQTRFGILTDIIQRQGKKGPYCTFTLQCKGFTQTGAAFNPQVIAHLHNMKGKKVRLRGTFDERTLSDGRKVQSFKAIWAGLDTPHTPST